MPNSECPENITLSTQDCDLMSLASLSSHTPGISPRTTVLYCCRQNFLNKRERSASKLSERHLFWVFLFVWVFFSFSYIFRELSPNCIAFSKYLNTCTYSRACLLFVEGKNSHSTSPWWF